MNAIVLVCDDVRMEMTGKVILIGVYTGNMLIPEDATQIPQLNFFFCIDCALDEIPKSLEFSVTMPGGEPIRSKAELGTPTGFKPEHTRWYVKHNVNVPGPILRPGKIATSVSVDGRAHPISTIWIEKGPMPQFTRINPTNALPPPSEQSPTSERPSA